MNNKSVFRPKGFPGVMYMILCVICAAALVTFTLTSPEHAASPVLIALSAVYVLHALGTVIAAVSGKKSGTWLISLIQSVALAAFIVLLGVCVFMLVGLSGGESGLLDSVNQLNKLVGLEPMTETALAGTELTSTSLSIAAGISAFSLLYSITALCTLSGLKGFYKGRNKTGGMILFGLLSIISAAAQLVWYASAGLGCKELAQLPQALSAIDFSVFAVSDWAFMIWSLSSALCFIAAAVCAFRIRSVIRRRKRAIQEGTFASPADEDYFSEDIPVRTTFSDKPANDTFSEDLFTESSDPFERELAEDPEPVKSEPVHELPEENGFPEIEEEFFPDAPETKAEQPAEPPSFPFEADDAEDSSVDREFAGCTVPPAAPVVTGEKTVGRKVAAMSSYLDSMVTDYGYSEDTII